MRTHKGFSLIELVTAIGIMIILGVVISLSLTEKKSKTDLTATTQKMGALLREAQSRSASAASSTTWGVHFNNVVTSTSYYSLFFGSAYNSSTEVGHYRLPINVRFVTSSLPEGSSSTVIFAQITGFTIPATSTSIGIELLPGQLPSGTISNATITVNMFGAISY